MPGKRRSAVTPLLWCALFSALWCSQAEARFLRKYVPDELTDERINLFNREYQNFISPNETYPIDAKPIFDRAPAGTYVSVGTERGFVSASMTPNASSLLLVDYDPLVVIYNRINIGLLTAATDHADYLWLRYKAPLDTVLARVLKAPVDDVVKQTITRGGFINWWSANTRGIGKRRAELEFFQRPPPVSGNHAFRDTNYLWYPDQFEKLSKMAKMGMIEAHILDFKDEAAVLRLSRAMNRAGVKISVLDVSNAWRDHYIGRKQTAHAVPILGEVATDDSIFLATSYSSLSKTHSPEMLAARTDARFSASGNAWHRFDHSRYFGFTFDELNRAAAQGTSLDQLLERLNFGYVESQLRWKQTDRMGTLNDAEILSGQRMPGAVGCFREQLQRLSVRLREIRR